MLATPTYLAAESPENRVAALMGGSVIDAAARAIGATTPSLKERLRKREGNDILGIVSSVGPQPDAALNRLREVL